MHQEGERTEKKNFKQNIFFYSHFSLVVSTLMVLTTIGIIGFHVYLLDGKMFFIGSMQLKGFQNTYF